MIDETFKYFWRRTVPGGIWWENKANTVGEIVYTMLIPIFASGFLSTRIENIRCLQPLHEAYSQAPWYVSYPASVVAFAVTMFICGAMLYFALKAIGFIVMVNRYRKFTELAEREWLLAITDLVRPTNLDKEEWLFDRIDELADANYQMWLRSRLNRA